VQAPHNKEQELLQLSAEDEELIKVQQHMCWCVSVLQRNSSGCSSTCVGFCLYCRGSTSGRDGACWLGWEFCCLRWKW
jgi:hypothetical protein